MKRCAGVLLAVSSLPSKQGIGDFGNNAYVFIDMLRKADMKIWQILPLNPLGFGNSPYQPYSSKAMDEIYISLEMLKEEGLLTSVRAFKSLNNEVVYYQEVREFKEKIIKLAYKNFKVKGDYKEFDHWVKNNKWVEDYAIFLTLKKINGLRMWSEWPKEHQNYIVDRKLKLGRYKDKIQYEKWVQFTLFKQWDKLHEYAASKGISIMGDVPFYVGIDSLDVWQNQKDFLLNGDGTASFIAGVPPDYFSATGQRWGNPIYNWEAIANEKFKFWIDRLTFNSKVFDIIRIDHFRAFDTYWKIPSSCPTAVEGEWIKAPGYQFFDTLFAQYPNLNIVAEDLGDLFPSVLELRDHYNLPGMNILQFTFEPDREEYGLKDKENQIVYTGTHDNETINGWIEKSDDNTKQNIRNKLNRLGYEDPDFAKCFVKLAFDNKADYCIIPMQDLLSLPGYAKMNTPSTIGSPNWEWKMISFDKFEQQIPYLKALVKDTRRD